MLKAFILFACLAVALGQTCLPGFDRYGSSCYFKVQSQLDFFDADQYCTTLNPKSYNIHLLSIESAAEENFIQQLINNDSVMRNRDVWLSATQIDKNKGWTWASTQQRVTYNNRESGRPSTSGKCAFMSWWYSYRWNNKDCDNRRSFICEYSIFGNDHAMEPEMKEWKAKVESGQLACPSGFHSYGKKCYYFIPSSLNWFDADQYCTMLVPKTYNIHLASIESAGEQLFIQDKIRGNPMYNNRQYWTSGNYMDRIQGWHWANNQRALSYNNWASGQPDGSGKCIQLWKDRNYTWDDADCEYTPYSHGFICELQQ